MAAKRDQIPKNTKEVRFIPLLVTLAIGAVIWFLPTPPGVKEQAWHLFAIFVATIVGLILKPLPMGSVAILAIMSTVLTKTLTIDDALSGFKNSTIWLIVIAFFISRGFIKTGLGTRIAYLFVKKFGKKTLGLSYSLLASDLSWLRLCRATRRGPEVSFSPSFVPFPKPSAPVLEMEPKGKSVLS